MKTSVISFALIASALAGGACSRSQPGQIAQAQAGDSAPAAAAPGSGLATVTLADGSRYRGSLLSNNGSQMTFRGTNGADRTFDSSDIRSISFADGGNASSANARPPRSGEFERPRVYSPDRTGDSAPRSEPVRREVVVPAGTEISVRNNDGISSKTASAGQTFSAVVVSDVMDNNGSVAIARGAAAMLVVREAGAGKIHANDLALDLSSITANGAPHEVRTATLFQKGKDGVGLNKRTAIFSGGGAAAGALIGGLIGGGRGAAIGAASGAGAGAGTEIFTRGSVNIPSESVLTFRLEAPLAL